MRTTYLVCYDVTDDKRLRRVFKAGKNFGDHLQYSVFECDLNPAEKIEMEETLKQLIKHDEDQVLFVTLGPAEGCGNRVITSLGLPYTKFDAPCFVFLIGSLTTKSASDGVMRKSRSPLAIRCEHITSGIKGGLMAISDH